jgi:hypothetical protein
MIFNALGPVLQRKIRHPEYAPQDTYFFSCHAVLEKNELDLEQFAPSKNVFYTHPEISTTNI